MRDTYIHKIISFAAVIMAIIASVSCSDDWLDVPEDTDRKVLLLYSAGFNNLSSYLKSDIQDLKSGWLPRGTSEDDVVLVYSHFPQSGYNTPTSPTLVRLYKGRDSKVIADTLVVYPAETISSSADQLNEVLSYISGNIKARSYGMIFSSHATGYLPTGYYQNQDNVFSEELVWVARRRGRRTAVPYTEPEHDPSMPMTKSIGQDQVGTSGSYLSHEIELRDFADAIPMYLDYILFDACLMGGVEVAYELKDKVGKIGFSQTEVLAEGFCYESLTSHLLNTDEPEPQRVCEDYFHQYEVMSGVYQSATISLIDCSGLEPLADICRSLFAKYADGISAVTPSKVQRFFRSGRHWFYDLESILINAGISDYDLRSLHEALDGCVQYKAHTPQFMNEFDIHTFCGFSMYLPNHGSEHLSDFYKTLKWNQATGLVK